jgi:hypothetical protein
MYPNNIFESFPELRYLKQPKEFIHLFIRASKFTWQRLTQGYSTYDLWGFDTYLENILANGLRDLADNHCGYPERLTPEKWTELLYQISKDIKEYSEYDIFKERDKDESLTIQDTLAQKEILRKKFVKSMNLLVSKYWNDLWD